MCSCCVRNKGEKKLSESFFLQKQCNSETLAKEFSLGDIKETASYEVGRAVGARGGGGGGGLGPFQISSDQLTLSIKKSMPYQNQGANNAPHPNFQTFLRPCQAKAVSSLANQGKFGSPCMVV